MRLFTENDKLQLITSDGVTIRDVRAGYCREGEHYDVIRVENGRWNVRKLAENDYEATDGTFYIRAFEKFGKTVIRGEFTCPENVESLTDYCVFRGYADERFAKAYINGATYLNGVSVCDMQAPSEVAFLSRNQVKSSYDFIVARSENRATVAGSVRFDEDFCCFTVIEDGEIGCFVPAYARKLRRGDKVKSNLIVVAAADDIRSGLELYASLTHALNADEIRETKSDIRSGWCSWYYYGQNIDEEKILLNMRELSERGADVDCIQVDDGWSVTRGDWEANERFPHGMKYLADRIKEAGFKAGIWVSPLTADENSALYRDHKDMFVKKRDSDEVFGYRPLDMSVQKSRDFLYDLFHKLSVEWGYRYIKFDFVLFGVSCGRHADPSFNGMKNLRAAFEIIRSAVTPDTFLLACSSPMAPALGYVDGIRISMDMFESWQSLRTVAAQVLERGFFASVIRVDPDCVMMRSAENEDADCFRLCTRTDREIETYLALIAVSGGTVMLSDKVDLLPPEKLEKFKKLLPPNEKAGVPVDMESSSIPSVVDCGERTGIRTVVLFNWQNRAETISFPLGKQCEVYDFFAGEFVRPTDVLRCVIEPHACKVYQCSEVGNSVILAARDRIVPELVYEKNDNGIRFFGMKRGERVVISSDRAIGKAQGATVKPLGDNYEITFGEPSCFVGFEETELCSTEKRFTNGVPFPQRN